MNSIIDECIADLRAVGVRGVEVYGRKLRQNQGNAERFADLLFEGRAAWVLQQSSIQITLRDRPDLLMSLGGEIVGAEVKHFLEKEQDRLDDNAMARVADVLVPIGDTTTEGAQPWEQICSVAVKKAKAGQYLENVPNILIVESSSEALQEMTETAVNQYYDELHRSRNDPLLRGLLRRLNGIMLVNTRSVGFSATGPYNVEFCEIYDHAVPMSKNVIEAIRNVGLGLPFRPTVLGY